MKPHTIIWFLAAFELIQGILTIRRYSDDTDPDIAIGRMPISAFLKVRAHILCAIWLGMTAQILWWLP